jgi:hypothetical protein
MEEIMENIREKNKENFLHDLRVLYLHIFYPLTQPNENLLEIFNPLKRQGTSHAVTVLSGGYQHL